MKIKVGSCPDSWGVWFADDPKQTPWHRFLDEIKEAGYEWMEIGPYGYLPTDPKTLKAELDQRGLKAMASFISGNLTDPGCYVELEKTFLEASELLVALGAEYIGLIEDSYTNLFTGESLAPARLDTDNWKVLIDTSQKLADKIKHASGLTLLYHHHADTHVEYEDQMEKFLADTDPDRISLCLDTGHFAYRGGDSVEFMRKHHKRIPYVHIKSVDAELHRKVETEKIPFALAVGMDLFCEPSIGVVDFEAFRDLLQELKYNGFVIVEQDMYPAPFEKPLPIAKRTRKYLSKIGIG